VSESFAHIDRNVAANVRTYREAAAISQEELAQRVTDRGFGFSQATVWKIESGHRPIRISEAVAIADALGLFSPDKLTIAPAAAAHHARIRQANRAAHDACKRIKAAVTDYLEAQINLTVAAREAHDAGEAVTEVDTTWLSFPVERATIEARVEHHTADATTERLLEEVDQIVEALRARGYSPLLDPADVEIVDDGHVRTWTPPAEAKGDPTG
jgi:transcriptional regulator with XRE-family HTH domain